MLLCSWQKNVLLLANPPNRASNVGNMIHNGTESLVPPFSTCVSAGILFFSRWRGQYYFLLGQERHQLYRRASRTWCDFAGGSKAGETFEYTAAREGFEEMCAIMPRETSSSRLRPVKDWGRRRFLPAIPCRKLWSRLHRRDFAMVIALPVYDRGKKEIPCPARTQVRICYLLEISWQPEISHRFHVARRELCRLARLLRQARTCPSCSSSFVASSPSPSPSPITLIPILKPPSADPYRPPHLRPRRMTPCASCWAHVARCWSQMPISLKSHPSISMNSKKSDDFVTHRTLGVCDKNRFKDLQVNIDYLEKSRLRYWSISELERSLRRRSFACADERLRESFCPLLKIAIRHLQRNTSRQQFQLTLK